MKQLLILSFVILTAQVAFSQNGINSDPSYSIHNYKHPNKAAYAKKHKKEKSTVIVTNTVKQDDNYKQKFNKPVASKKAVVVIKKEKDKSNKSYKHPYGL